MAKQESKRVQEPSHLYGTHIDLGSAVVHATPDRFVDRRLVRRLLELEVSYNGEDLKESSVRQQHLELCARLFADYSGERMKKDDLVHSVHYVSREEFDSRKRGAAHALATTERDGGIWVSEESKSYSNQSTAETRKVIPWWSALSRVRYALEHEWYHRAGIPNVRTDLNDILAEAYEGYEVIDANGFAVTLRNKTTGETMTDIVLEEGFAYYMGGDYLEKLLTGYQLTFSRDIETLGEQALAVNNCIKLLNQLFRVRPDWRERFQHFHRISDSVGLARFLADSRGLAFSTEEERDKAGFDALSTFKSIDGSLNISTG